MLDGVDTIRARTRAVHKYGLLFLPDSDPALPAAHSLELVDRLARRRLDRDPHGLAMNEQHAYAALPSVHEALHGPHAFFGVPPFAARL